MGVGGGSALKQTFGPHGTSVARDPEPLFTTTPAGVVEADQKSLRLQLRSFRVRLLAVRRVMGTRIIYPTIASAGALTRGVTGVSRTQIAETSVASRANPASA
jgi:hypothetical protein